MATVIFRVTYSQGSDPAIPGTITFHYEDSSESQAASGRLDHNGAMVFADGFVGLFSYTISIECIRKSRRTMDVRLTFIPGVPGTEDPYEAAYEGYCRIVHRVLENVPINFE